MDKLDRRPVSSARNNGNQVITRKDTIELLRVIRALLEDMEYVTVPVFKAVTSKMIAAFVRGMGGPTSIADEIAARLRSFSRRSQIPEARWFADWVEKANLVGRERTQRTSEPGGDSLIHYIFPRLAVPMEDFGYCMVNEKGTEIALVTLGGFVHVLHDIDDLERLGLTILDTAAEVRRSRDIIPAVNTGVPENYGEQVIGEWQDAIVADAWLVPPDDEAA